MHASVPGKPIAPACAALEKFWPAAPAAAPCASITQPSSSAVAPFATTAMDDVPSFIVDTSAASTCTSATFAPLPIASVNGTLPAPAVRMVFVVAPT
jgi:hypothetical protein